MANKLDEWIRTSLREEQAPPPAMQEALIQKIRRHDPSFRMSWWGAAAFGGMQTIALVSALQVLLPDSLLSYLAIPAGACLIVCAAVLAKVADRTGSPCNTSF